MKFYIGAIAGALIAIFMCSLFADLSSRDNFWDYSLSIVSFAIIGAVFEYLLWKDV